VGEEMKRKAKCQCTLSQAMVGDGCRFCQPQEHIDRLEEWVKDNAVQEEYIEKLEDEIAALKAYIDKGFRVGAFRDPDLGATVTFTENKLCPKFNATLILDESQAKTGTEHQEPPHTDQDH
jgi:hypothetical protein